MPASRNDRHVAAGSDGFIGDSTPSRHQAHCRPVGRVAIRWIARTGRVSQLVTDRQWRNGAGVLRIGGQAMPGPYAAAAATYGTRATKARPRIAWTRVRYRIVLKPLCSTESQSDGNRAVEQCSFHVKHKGADIDGKSSLYRINCAFLRLSMPSTRLTKNDHREPMGGSRILRGQVFSADGNEATRYKAQYVLGASTARSRWTVDRIIIALGVRQNPPIEARFFGPNSGPGTCRFT